MSFFIWSTELYSMRTTVNVLPIDNYSGTYIIHIKISLS